MENGEKYINGEFVITQCSLCTEKRKNYICYYVKFELLNKPKLLLNAPKILNYLSFILFPLVVLNVGLRKKAKTKLSSLLPIIEKGVFNVIQEINLYCHYMTHTKLSHVKLELGNIHGSNRVVSQHWDMTNPNNVLKMYFKLMNWLKTI
jgi:hypothetical protein